MESWSAPISRASIFAHSIELSGKLHHEGGSQRVFLNGLAILANLIPYQRRAINSGKCAVEVEGGKVPTKDWFLNLQILTSGGFQ